MSRDIPIAAEIEASSKYNSGKYFHSADTLIDYYHRKLDERKKWENLENLIPHEEPDLKHYSKNILITHKII